MFKKSNLDQVFVEALLWNLMVGRDTTWKLPYQALQQISL